MRKSTKSFTVITASVALLAAGCSSGSGASASGTADAAKPAGDGTVTIFHRWTDAHQVAIEAAMAKCDEELTDLTIKITSSPADQYEVQLPVALSSSNPPDIYALWPGGRPLFQAKSGVIAPMTDFYNEKIAPGYAEGANKGATEVDGEVYVMPFNVQPTSFYYRTDIFAKYGLSVPTTFDELVTVAQTLKDNGETPFLLGSGKGWEPLFWFDYFVMRTAGPEFRARLMNGQESYTDPKVVEAMDKWGELIKAGFFNDNITSTSWDDMTPAMVDGRGVIMLMGSWAVQALADAGLEPEKQFDTFAFPQIDSSVTDSAEGAMEGWATSGGRDNVDQVHEVLQCLSSTASLTQYAKDFTTLTPDPKVAIDVYPADKQHFVEQWKAMTLGGVFQENLELATTPAVTDVAKREFPRFLSDPSTSMQVLDALETASQQEFGKS